MKKRKPSPKAKPDVPFAAPDWSAAKSTMWPLEKIKPYPKNPRTHPDSQVALLADLMKRFGPDQPIVVDEKGVILKGHGRRLAAIKAGFDEFPVAQHFDLSSDDKRAIRIADNKVALLSDWDPALLRLEIDELKLADFDLTLLGFSQVELAALNDGSGDGEAPTVSLAERFGIVPFSVFNAREGVWQARKQAWLALGFKSELGRGDNLIGRSPQELFCHYTGIPYGKARKIVTDAMEKLGDKFDLAALVKEHGGKVSTADFSRVDMSPTIKRLKPSADQAHKNALKASAP